MLYLYMNMITNMDNDILQFEKKILNINLNQNDIEKLINELYKLKKKYINDIRNTKLLDNIHNYLKYKLNKIESRKRHILTLTNLIFLPLGIIVGYFGMNFKSMGNKGIKNGILSIKYANIFTIVLFLISIVFVISMYYYYFVIKKF